MCATYLLPACRRAQANSKLHCSLEKPFLRLFTWTFKIHFIVREITTKSNR